MEPGSSRLLHTQGVVTKTSRSAQYSGWKNLVQNGYMAMRPVVPKSLATTINKLNSSGEACLHVILRMGEILHHLRNPGTMIPL